MAVFFLKHQRKGKIKLICNREKRRFLSVISKLHAVSLLLEEDSTKYKTNKQKVELGVKSSQNRARVTSPVSHTSQSARSTDTPATVPARPARPPTAQLVAPCKPEAAEDVQGKGSEVR
jgi:hypothetical protein